MSNIKVQGNVSGTGSLTIAAPNTNTDITINLPSTLGNAGASSFVTTDASGNLGIGTSSPTQKLHIAGGSSLVGVGQSYYSYTSDFGIGTPDSDQLQIFAGASNGIRFGNRTSGTFTERARIDSSGNLLVGTTSAIGKLTVYKAGSSYADSLVLSNDSAYGANQGIAWGSSANISGRIKGVDDGAYGTNLIFETRTGGPSTSTTERARIDSSGTLLVGQTTNPATSTLVIKVPTGSANGVNAQITSNTGTSYPWSNYNATGTYVGGISCTSTATSFPTSSDYRLKHDVQPMTNALAKVQQLKPCTYKWNLDDSHGEGFIAHELAEVVPLAVVGEKDAVDADGKPVYQGIDTSFLVATLTAAIQEQQAIITQLQADVAALKGAA